MNSVDRPTLLTGLNRPHRLGLSRQEWQAAAVLAGLRVAINDPVRARDRDRGTRKNWLADIWGTIGELAALRTVHSLADLPVRHHPIDFHGSVDEVDLVIGTAAEPLRLEAKAHLMEPGKSWFMVNMRARERSRRRGADGYLPVVSVLGGPVAAVGRLISIGQLQSWGVPDKPLRDPAVGIPLTELAASCFDLPLSDLEAAIKGGLSISPAELTRLAADAGKDLARWQSRLPPLEDLPAGDVVEAITRHL
jgi:hypothetical protein